MDTGPDLHEERELNDGTPVILRHIRPEDATELKRGFDKLSPASRFRRFLGAVNALSDEQLHYLTHVDGQDHVAIVATLRPADPSIEPVGLGVARYVRLKEDPEVAEAAITVADEWQGKGLGRMLSLTLARAAQERGVKRFRGEVLADNDVVKGLLADVGAAVKEEPEGVVFEVDLIDTHFEPGSPLDVVARKLLRAAATVLAGLFRGVKKGKDEEGKEGTEGGNDQETKEFGVGKGSRMGKDAGGGGAGTEAEGAAEAEAEKKPG